MCNSEDEAHVMALSRSLGVSERTRVRVSEQRDKKHRGSGR